MSSETILNKVIERLGLTPRETDVVSELCAGCSVEEAAGRIDITMSTVRTHLRSIYQKCNVQTRAQLAALVLNQVLEIVDEMRDEQESAMMQHFEFRS